MAFFMRQDLDDEEEENATLRRELKKTKKLVNRQKLLYDLIVGRWCDQKRVFKTLPKRSSCWVTSWMRKNESTTQSRRESPKIEANSVIQRTSILWCETNLRQCAACRKRGH